ncbi:hypothetical protein PCANC_02561 [Puccinia coronata f. sp. avenae]|uniref:Uncharacterized protein n=1 Tax=Puccinia coronata f. sp. avenae TaxID=200324 RepID=A0A2N5SN33_9BASI|nr:hypothetical protein PCASD_19902 [Puccinia coronata f. sp. avenae]PLW55042.1 hypothetical protein PCANC_02561 [Puccinia coronata f. sp. avenae]
MPRWKQAHGHYTGKRGSALDNGAKSPSQGVTPSYANGLVEWTQVPRLPEAGARSASRREGEVALRARRFAPLPPAGEGLMAVRRGVESDLARS